MAVVKVKGIELGAGMPKICVPLTDKNMESMRISLEAMKGAQFDLIEWRADKFEQLFDEKALSACSQMIREAFPDKPLIFTIRTNMDMEDFEISTEDYIKLNTYASAMNLADLFDIEYSRGVDVVKILAAVVHISSCLVIVSKHVAAATPATEEIVQTLCDMQATGADIVKYAAMPNAARDTLRLMDATLTMTEEHPDTPIITMAMSRLGALSRVSGSLTGSCLTFGTVGAASAPGQIPCGDLHKILQAL